MTKELVMRKYYHFRVKKAVTVTNLVTIEHIVLPPNFLYPEESHAFHEFIYVDNGSICCYAQNSETLLKQGDFFLIPPETPHRHVTQGDQSATAFFVCFGCKSEYSAILNGKSTLDKAQKKLITDIIAEAKNAFRFPFNKKLIPLDSPHFASQQLIENRIEELLIKLIRQKINENVEIKLVMNTIEFENGLVNDIVTLLKEHLYGSITLDLIAERTFYSKTYVNNIFKKNIGYSVIQYYTRMKIQEAKKLLRENLPASTVADKLQFESPNYFTKVFKKHTGLTPSAYKKSALQ